MPWKAGIMMRWTPTRKAAILVRLDAGDEEARKTVEHHSVSQEELADWRVRFAAAGKRGLRVSKSFKREIQV